jgi:hypothetical protein
MNKIDLENLLQGKILFKMENSGYLRRPFKTSGIARVSLKQKLYE